MIRGLFLVAFGVLVIGCGSDSDGASGGPTTVDACLGSFVKSDDCGSVYSDRVHFAVESTSGTVPPQFTGGTSCSSSPGKTTSIYSDVVDYPLGCDSAWSFQFRMNEGENAKTLAVNGDMGAVSVPKGSMAVVLDTELDGCSKSAHTYLPTGQGALELKVVSANAPSCAVLTFLDVELAEGAESFRFTGTLRAKFLPVAAQ